MPIVGRIAETGMAAGAEFRGGPVSPNALNYEFVRQCERALSRWLRCHGASRPHRRGGVSGEDHQPLHEPGNRLRDPRQARPKRGRADRGAGRVAAAAVHRARRDGARDAADGAVPALDERHARSVRGGGAAA